MMVYLKDSFFFVETFLLIELGFDTDVDESIGCWADEEDKAADEDETG